MRLRAASQHGQNRFTASSKVRGTVERDRETTALRRWAESGGAPVYCAQGRSGRVKSWKVATIIGVLAAVGLLAAVAIASGADTAISGVGERGSARCDGDGAGRLNEAETLEGSEAFAEGHRADMQGLMRGSGLGRGAGSRRCEGTDSDDCDCVGHGQRLGRGQGCGQGDGHGEGQGVLGGGNVW